jgi:hypothetical protein
MLGSAGIQHGFQPDSVNSCKDRLLQELTSSEQKMQAESMLVYKD